MKKRENKRQSLTHMLQKAKLRVTEPRLTVIQALLSNRKPLCIKDLQKNLSTGKRVDVVTLYRIVEALRGCGLVRRVELGKDAAYYEIEDRQNDYHQVICTKCGCQADYKECMFLELRPRILRQARNFSDITCHSLTYFGICKQCTKKTEPKKVNRKK